MSAIMRLHWCLYGLPAASRCFNDHLSATLLSDGFKRLISDPQIYIKQVDDKKLICSTHVDDLLCAATRNTSLLPDMPNHLSTVYNITVITDLKNHLALVLFFWTLFSFHLRFYNNQSRLDSNWKWWLEDVLLVWKLTWMCEVWKLKTHENNIGCLLKYISAYFVSVKNE